jgi:hypothetical protein
MNDEELDLDSRQLCPDGACTGIIGPDGRCKECGRRAETSAYRGDVPDPTPGLPDEQPLAAPDEDEEDADRFDDDRQLCSDGSCIGVLGTDGKCRQCGRMADAQVSS